MYLMSLFLQHISRFLILVHIMVTGNYFTKPFRMCNLCKVNFLHRLDARFRIAVFAERSYSYLILLKEGVVSVTYILVYC